MSDEMIVTPEAKKIANVAFNEARDEGCNCDPNIVLTPTDGTQAGPTAWRAVVEHDDWCRLVRRIRANLS